MIGVGTSKDALTWLYVIWLPAGIANTIVIASNVPDSFLVLIVVIAACFIYVAILMADFRFCNIRFWDIGRYHDKSCLVGIEAATENKGLHPRIPTFFEATEAGQARRWSHSGGGCQTGFPAPVLCVEVRIWGTKGGFCRTATFGEDLQEVH